MNHSDTRISKLPLRYSDIEYLAEGGMGVVYKAYDNELNRTVVIKLLQGSKDQKNTMWRKRLVREAKSLCTLRHQNVVKVYDFHSSADLSFIVLEYLEGTVLTELMTSDPLSCDEVLKLVAELAEGLEAIHDAGLIHRDIKPANIIITYDGQPTFIDFGLTTFSADADIEKTQTRLTETDCIVGTIGYLAPELLLGNEHSKKCDIFQLGVIFHELLTGKQLINLDTFNRMLKGEFPGYGKPSHTNEKIDSSIDDIVMSAIDPDPKKRTETAGKLAQQCRACLGMRKPKGRAGVRTIAAASIVPDEENKKKTIWFLTGLSLFIVFMILAVHLTPGTEKPPAFSLSSTVDSVSVTLEGRHSWFLTELESRKIVVRGNTEGASSFHCNRLRPETEYGLHIDGTLTETFRTKSPGLTDTPHVWAFDKTIFLRFSANVKSAVFRLVVNDSVEKNITVEAGAGEIIIKEPEFSRVKSIRWKLYYKKMLLASGTKSNSVDFHLERAFGQNAHPLPCWLGSDLLLADRNSQFRLLRPGTKLREVLSFNSDGTALRFRRTILSIDDKTALYTATPYGANVLFNIVKAHEGKVSEGRVNLPAAVDMDQAPSFASKSLFFNGLCQMKPSWFLVDAEKQQLLSYMQAERVTAVRSDESTEKIISINFGKSKIRSQGSGFICSPKIEDGRVWSMFGQSLTRDTNSVDCKLYSLALTDRNTKLGKPVLHGSFTTWLGKHQFGYTGKNKILSCSGLKRIFAIEPKRASLKEVINISGKINIPQEAYIGSPAFSLQNRNYAVIFSDVLSKPGQLGAFISQKEAFLIYWKNGRSVPVLEKRLFIEPAGTFQAPAVSWMRVWKERYLIGATSLTLFAVDLETMNVGSVHYAGDIITSVVLSDQGIVALALQGNRFSMIPVELIPFQ